MFCQLKNINKQSIIMWKHMTVLLLLLFCCNQRNLFHPLRIALVKPLLFLLCWSNRRFLSYLLSAPFANEREFWPLHFEDWEPIAFTCSKIYSYTSVCERVVQPSVDQPLNSEITSHQLEKPPRQATVLWLWDRVQIYTMLNYEKWRPRKDIPFLPSKWPHYLNFGNDNRKFKTDKDLHFPFPFASWA